MVTAGAWPPNARIIQLVVMNESIRSMKSSRGGSGDSGGASRSFGHPAILPGPCGTGPSGYFRCAYSAGPIVQPPLPVSTWIRVRPSPRLAPTTRLPRLRKVASS